MLRKTIFVDMDGVVVWFTKSVFEIMGTPELINNWPENASNIAQATGYSYAEIWGKVDALGNDFWSNLEEYSYFDKMYQELVKLADVCFLTSPSLSPYAASGKVLWLQKKYGWKFRDYIITSHKHHCAHPNSLLIDDTQEKIDKFQKNGGATILFPQPWNSNAHVKDKLEYVLDKARLWSITR